MDSNTAQSLIDEAYINIRGLGPGYASDNLKELDKLTQKNRFKFNLSRYELSKVGGEITPKDCKKVFEGIL
jgi:hypothetical protein